MSWLVRLFLWASVLSLPCWFLQDSYGRWLAASAARWLPWLGLPGQVDTMSGVPPPVDLGFYAALCLASRRSPRRTRARALAIGVPCLIAVDVMSHGLGIVLSMPRDVHGVAGLSTRLFGAAMATLPWVSACGLWLPLLGFAELPRLAPATSDAPAQARMAEEPRSDRARPPSRMAGRRRPGR